MNRRQFLRRFPKPVAPKNGLYIRDPDTGEEIFVTWAELKSACRMVMSLPEDVAQTELGKPNFRYDPDYNMRRRR